MSERSHRGRVEWPCGPDCPRRHPGCQDHCPDMIKAKEENARKLAQEHKTKELDSAYRRSVRRACRANKKY